MQITNSNSFQDNSIVITEKNTKKNALDNSLSSIAIDRYKQANEEMLTAYPSLKNTLKELNENSVTERKIFEIFVNHLHQEAENLGHDEKIPEELDGQDKIQWELDHYTRLLQKLKEGPELMVTYNRMLQDFNVLPNCSAKADFLFAYQQLKIQFMDKEILKKDPEYSDLIQFLDSTTVYSDHLLHFQHWTFHQHKNRYKDQSRDNELQKGHLMIAFGYIEAKNQNKLPQFFESFKVTDTCDSKNHLYAYGITKPSRLELILNNVQEFMLKKLDLNVIKK